MNRFLLVIACCVFSTPLLAQEGRVRVSSAGSEESAQDPQPGIVLRIMKVVNGTVPGYDLDGNVVPGSSVKYVLVDMYGRQRGAIGTTPQQHDHKISIAYYDGYIEAAEVGKFALAKTAKTPNGSVAAFRPGATEPTFALVAEDKPSQGLLPDDE